MSTPTDALRDARRLWGAFVGVSALFLVLSALAPPRFELAGDQAPLFAAIGAVNAVAGLTLVPLLRRGDAYRSVLILRLAGLLTASAIGVVLSLGQQASFGLALALGAALAMLTMVPTQERIDAWVAGQ